MRRALLAAAAALACLPRPARAAPAEVIIIRHAEQSSESPGLDDVGQLRAKALVGFFKRAPAVTKHGPPVAIYAVDPDQDHGSPRALETVTPLAKALKLTVDTRFKRKRFPKLVREILDTPAYNGKTVLLCWEREAIPDIPVAFGWNGSPPKWPGDVYDRVWILRFIGEDVYTFADLPQRLLPDDSAN